MNTVVNPCSVCHNSLVNNNLVVFSCNHSIHLDCFSGILKNSSITPRCPLCRLHLCDFVGFGIVEDDTSSDTSSEMVVYETDEEDEPFLELHLKLEKKYRYCFIITILIMIFFGIFKEK